MSTPRIAALLLMIAGFGWIAGNFAPPAGPFWPDGLISLAHALPIALILLCGLPLIQHRDGGPRWALRVVTAVAVLFVLFTIGDILFSVTHPDPNAFGLHSLADIEPAVVLNAGTLLWLAARVPLRARVVLAPRHARS